MVLCITNTGKVYICVCINGAYNSYNLCTGTVVSVTRLPMGWKKERERGVLLNGAINC